MCVDLLKKNVLPIVIVANLVVLFVCMLVNGWRYESCDDYFMHSVMTGAYGGAYDLHLYFVNVAYAVFLRPFYALFPSVGWYSLFEATTVLISFSAIFYLLIKQYGNKLGGILSLLLLSCVSLDFYLHIEFTRCAGVATAAGIFLFSVGNKEKKRQYLLFGGLLMLVGFVFRKEMFLLGLPTLAVILFYSVITKRFVWKWSVAFLAVLAAMILGLKNYDLSLYKNNEYEYYAAYQKARAYFGDGGFFDARAFSDELDEKGIGSRNYRYLRAWYFYDDNVFSLDSMNALIQIANRYVYKPNFLKMPFAVVRTISNGLGSRVWLWALLGFSLIYFSNKKCWWVPWISFVLVCLPYAYLLMVNRVLDHVEAGIWAYAIIFVLFFIDRRNYLTGERNRNLILIVSLVCVAGLVNSVITYSIGDSSRRHGPNGADWGKFLEYVQERPDDVYLLPFERYMQLAEFLGTTYKAVPPHSWDNIYSTGYWNIHLPPMKYELEKRGVTNIFRDIKKDNVYTISDKKSLSFVPFYFEHYHELLEIDTIRAFGNIFLLKYRLKEISDEAPSH